MSRNNYNFLDGVRGLAALYVVFFHIKLATEFSGDLGAVGELLMWWAAAGIPAVIVFIVLSGFLLTLPVARTGALRGGIREFFLRRCWRILPGYYFALLGSAAFVCIAAPWAFNDPRFFGHHAWSQSIVQDLIVHAFMLQNLSPNLYAFDGVLWSVATEWQIYIVFALLLVPARTRFGPVVAASLGLVLAAIALASAAPGSVWMLGCFALGGLAAEVAEGALRGWLTRVSWSRLAAAGGSIIVIWLGIRAFGRGANATMAINILTAVTACAGILAIRRGGVAADRVRRFLESDIASRLGAFSYSIYLVHAPVIMWADAWLRTLGFKGVSLLWIQLAIVLPIALLLAYLFHLAIERPALRRKQHYMGQTVALGHALTGSE